MIFFKAENVFLTQVRVILSLILRDTRVAFGPTKLGYIWAIANPMLSTIILVLVFSAISSRPAIGTSFILFFATGVFPFEMNRKITSSLMHVFKSNKGLMVYPLIKEIDVVIARFSLIFVTYAIIFIIFFSGLILLGLAEAPRAPEQILLALLVTTLIGLGGGLVNAVIFGLWPTWQQIEGIFSRPLFFLSGIFFVPSLFSPEVRYFLSWNPLLHITEWVREGYYGYYQSLVLDKSYVISWAGLLVLIGFGAERLYRKKIS